MIEKLTEIVQMRFIPIFEDKEFTDAVEDYKQIWETEGSKILNAFQKITNLTLLETRICAVVYDGVSFSGRSVKDMMKMRFSYDMKIKKGTLIHELSHRLLFNLKNKPDTDDHPIIFLFLYDVWIELYSEEFANKMVEVEKKRGEKYLNAWNSVLSFSPEQRKIKFAEFCNDYK